MPDIFDLNLSNGKQYPYQIIYSKRAKYIRLKLSRRGELSVTLPSLTKPKLAHDFVQSKLRWIEKNLQGIDYQTINKLPELLNLQLLNEVWTIKYLNIDDHESSYLTLKECGNTVLELQGTFEQINNHGLVAKILNNWCRKKAKTIFNEMLQGLAELHGFHYQRLSIRSQKTRWGSCSQQKNINLNAKLLFMPDAIVKYVMIHELCHTLEMNHSARFWDLVEDCDPQYMDHQQQLKTLGRKITI